MSFPACFWTLRTASAIWSMSDRGPRKRRLVEPDALLAEPVVGRAVDPLEVIGDPLGRIDRAETAGTGACSSGTAPGRAGCSRPSRGFPRRAAPRGTCDRGRPSKPVGIIPEHVEMIGIPRAAVVHARRGDAGDLAEQPGEVGGVLLAAAGLLLEPGELRATGARPGTRSCAGWRRCGRSRDRRRSAAAVVLEAPALLEGQSVVVGEDRAALARVEVLRGLEAEAAQVAERAELLGPATRPARPGRRLRRPAACAWRRPPGSRPCRRPSRRCAPA